jgi:8-oxo-dGTP diphosphatase
VSQLFVVRHADAGSRGTATVPDAERELTDRGQRQAEGVRDLLADRGITRLLASPAVRCVQTLEPLAAALSLKVEQDDRLAEGSGAEGALALGAEVRGETAVLCSHGDVIPDLLEHLLARGTRIDDELRWPKASTWVIAWDGDEAARARYLPPPA